MERDIIQEWASLRKINLSGVILQKIFLFAEMIYAAKQKFNITGFKSREEILTELILKSIDPVCDIIVPRGTQFADLGSGAGVPGIPLSIYFNNLSGILIESSSKKAEFILSAIKELKLTGLNVVCDRAEIAGREQLYREKFDWCFARAVGKLYAALELGAPFVRMNGHLYIYSNIIPDGISLKILEHAEKLGLGIMSHKEYEDIKLSWDGLCFKKKGNIPDKYPRAFAKIKSESERIKEQ